jgi:hypothetical protein
MEALDLAPVLGWLSEAAVGWGVRVRVRLQGCPPVAALGSFLLGVLPERLLIVRLGLLDGEGRSIGREAWRAHRA